MWIVSTFVELLDELAVWVTLLYSIKKSANELLDVVLLKGLMNIPLEGLREVARVDVLKDLCLKACEQPLQLEGY